MGRIPGCSCERGAWRASPAWLTRQSQVSAGTRCDPDSEPEQHCSSSPPTRNKLCQEHIIHTCTLKHHQQQTFLYQHRIMTLLNFNLQTVDPQFFHAPDSCSVSCSIILIPFPFKENYFMSLTCFKYFCGLTFQNQWSFRSF